MAPEPTRIVIVEDDRDARESLQRLLECHGYDVRTAQDAPTAATAIEDFRPVGVVLDLGLPDTASGLKLAAWLQHRYGPTMVLVVVTGCRALEDLDTARAAGADYVLPKPLDVDRLNSILSPLAHSPQA